MTDARYFSAWNVDYLAYVIGESGDKEPDLERIQAIRAWVEGPKFALEFMTDDIDRIIIQSQELDADAVIVEPDVAYPEWPVTFEWFYKISAGAFNEPAFTLSPGQERADGLILYVQDGEIPEASRIADWKERNEHLIIVEFNAPIAPRKFLSSIGMADGITVMGGDEEKVGFKSFDELDEILELLNSD